MQNGVVAEAYERDAVVTNIAILVDAARAASVPVVWVQHSDDHVAIGSEGWNIVPELTPAEDESRIRKNYADAFEDTELEEVLAQRAIGQLVIAGAQTDECIRSSLHGAFVRGYDATLVSDAHTTEDLSEWGAPTPDLVIAHTNLYWGNHRAPGRTAAAMKTAEIDFAS